MLRDYANELEFRDRNPPRVSTFQQASVGVRIPSRVSGRLISEHNKIYPKTLQKILKTSNYYYFCRNTEEI